MLGLLSAGGTAYVVLRNPWGGGEAAIDTLSGTFQAQTNTYQPTIPLGARGVFALKLSTFKSHFAGLAAIHS